MKIQLTMKSTIYINDYALTNYPYLSVKLNISVFTNLTE